MVCETTTLRGEVLSSVVTGVTADLIPDQAYKSRLVCRQAACFNVHIDVTILVQEVRVLHVSVGRHGGVGGHVMRVV